MQEAVAIRDLALLGLELEQLTGSSAQVSPAWILSSPSLCCLLSCALAWGTGQLPQMDQPIAWQMIA